MTQANADIISQAIEGTFSTAKGGIDVQITPRGDSSYGSELQRFSISVEINGVTLQFNVGENIIFLLDGQIHNVLKFANLARAREVRTFTNKCLEFYQVWMGTHELPLVKEFTLKHFGRHLRVRKKSHNTIIDYPTFQIIVTPRGVGAKDSQTKRLVVWYDLENPRYGNDLDRTIGLMKGVLQNLKIVPK